MEMKLETKKYKQGEFGSVSGMAKKEKLDSSMITKYSQGEFSADVGKNAKDKIESFAKEKYSQGSHNS